MKAYVLAAGYATRLHPLTLDVPKTLLMVGGRPILSHVVDRLRSLAELSEVVIVGNDRFHGQLRAWVEAQEPWVPFTLLNDGSTRDENKLGALGDLAFALREVPLGGEEAVVLASDNLVDLDLGEVQREFRERGGATIVVRQVEHGRGPSRYNDVVLDDDGRIVRFREKPDRPEGDLAAIALYFFRADHLGLLDDYLAGGQPDAPGHFIAWLVDRVPCYAHRLTSPWYDIGSLETLAEARERFGA